MLHSCNTHVTSICSHHKFLNTTYYCNQVIAKLQIQPNKKTTDSKIWKGSIFAWLVGWLVGRSSRWPDDSLHKLLKKINMINMIKNIKNIKYNKYIKYIKYIKKNIPNISNMSNISNISNIPKI